MGFREFQEYQERLEPLELADCLVFRGSRVLVVTLVQLGRLEHQEHLALQELGEPQEQVEYLGLQDQLVRRVHLGLLELQVRVK